MRKTIVAVLAIGLWVLATTPVEAAPDAVPSSDSGDEPLLPLGCMGLPCDVVNAVCKIVLRNPCLG